MKDKVTVVTGAKSGIGRATVRRFVREGATVVLADVQDTEADVRELRDSGATVLSLETDVRDDKQVDRLVASTREAFGRLDILVNAAGVARRAPLADVGLDDWDWMIDVNLKGTFLCCRAAIPAMRDGGGGAIVNIGSELGLIGAPGIAAYGASKGGVIQLTRALAVETAADGIRVNCLCPGPVLTPMLEGSLARSPDPDEARRRSIADTLIGRFGTPEEMANVIRFLASDESSYMTGSIVVADGGVTAK